MEEAKKMKCYKRLKYKRFVQVSGLCGPKFLSYLPKRFMHLCRALWRRHIGVPFWSTNMAAGNQQKRLEFTFSKKLFLFTRELAYVRINISSNTWNGYTAENQEERLFFQRDSIPILVSRTVKTRKFKLLYFRNETCYGNGNLYKDLLFVYLQPSVNKNS